MRDNIIIHTMVYRISRYGRYRMTEPLQERIEDGRGKSMMSADRGSMADERETREMHSRDALERREREGIEARERATDYARRASLWLAGARSGRASSYWSPSSYVIPRHELKKGGGRPTFLHACYCIDLKGSDWFKPSLWYEWPQQRTALVLLVHHFLQGLPPSMPSFRSKHYWQRTCFNIIYRTSLSPSSKRPLLDATSENRRRCWLEKRSISIAFGYSLKWLTNEQTKYKTSKRDFHLWDWPGPRRERRFLGCDTFWFVMLSGVRRFRLCSLDSVGSRIAFRVRSARVGSGVACLSGYLYAWERIADIFFTTDEAHGFAVEVRSWSSQGRLIHSSRESSLSTFLKHTGSLLRFDPKYCTRLL